MLRQNSDQALDTWISIIRNYCSNSTSSNNDDDDNMLTELKRCDILWSQKPDPIRHSYFQEVNDGDSDVAAGDDNPYVNDPSTAFHAIMINDHDIGGVLLESQMAPGLYIRIQDELSLWDDELWVNDRGHDAKNGAMVYGNHLSVPYKMNRVASLISTDVDQFERSVTDNALSWTLGDQFRTKEEYDAKMEDIGGVSVSFRPKKTS